MHSTRRLRLALVVFVLRVVRLRKWLRLSMGMCSRGGADLGPLVGKRTWFKTKERMPHSDGLSGVDMNDHDNNPVIVVFLASSLLRHLAMTG